MSASPIDNSSWQGDASAGTAEHALESARLVYVSLTQGKDTVPGSSENTPLKTPVSIAGHRGHENALRSNTDACDNAHSTLCDGACDSSQSLSSNPLYYIENAYGYTQIITEITRKITNTESIIDVLQTSNPEFHTKAGAVKYALSDHYLIQTVIAILCNKTCQISQNHNEVINRDFKQFDHYSFTEDIKAANEPFVNLETGITWEMWKSTFLEICNKHVPLIKARLKARKNQWITPDIVKMMYERDHLHAKAIKYGDPILMNNYRKLRNRITSEIEKKKYEHF